MMPRLPHGGASRTGRWHRAMHLRCRLASVWGSIVLALLSLAMLLWTYQTGRDLGMADGLSRLSWARAGYSTAIAISRLDFGAPDYLIFSSVWRHLTEGGFRDNGLGVILDPWHGIENARHIWVD